MGAGLGFYLSSGQENQGEERYGGQAEVDVNVGEQAALGDHVGLKELQGAELRVAAAAAIAVNQIRVLRQGGPNDGIEAIGHIE